MINSTNNQSTYPQDGIAEVQHLAGGDPQAQLHACGGALGREVATEDDVETHFAWRGFEGVEVDGMCVSKRRTKATMLFLGQKQ